MGHECLRLLVEVVEGTKFRLCNGETLTLTEVPREEMLSLSVLPFRIGGPNECASTNTCTITGQVAHVVDVWPSSIKQFGGRDTPLTQAHHFQ